MREYLSRIAVGPSGSRDLSESEAYDALSLCLTRAASDVQIGVFLIAERLKRETRDENVGFLRALMDASAIVTAPTDRVVSLCDPYDGFRRVPHFAPVVAALLGAVGIPTLLHGVRSMPPKHGLTHRVVLEAMGMDLGIGQGADSVAEAAKRLATHHIAYVDLQDFCPSLHGLIPVRESIAKRPFLATLEKLIIPIRGRKETHAVAGWVHAGYETLMTDLMHGAGLETTFLVKGREGHTDLNIGRETSLWIRNEGENGQAQTTSVPSAGGGGSGDETTVKTVVELWRSILSGEKTPYASSSVHLAAHICVHLDPSQTLKAAQERVEQARIEGRAGAVFNNLGVNGPVFSSNPA